MNRKRDIQGQDREKEGQALSLMYQALLFVRIARIQYCLTLSANNADFIMEDTF